MYLCGLCLPAFAQVPEQPNEENAQGRQGSWVIYYSRDWKQVDSPNKAAYYRELSYRDGKVVGPVRDYYATGQLQEEIDSLISEKPELVHGLRTSYFKSGVILGYEQYDKGQLDFPKTIELMKQLSEDHKQTYGRNHVRHIRVLYRLARVYLKQGNYLELEPVTKEISEIYKETKGADSKDYATSLHSLANVHRMAGNYDKAEEYGKAALGIRNKLYGKKHPQVAHTLNLLATIYYYTGDFKKSERLYRLALNIFEASSGHDTPQYASNLNNLAILYRRMGNYTSAEDLYSQSRDIIEKAYGKNHVEYATALNNLANLKEDQGKHKEAIPLLNVASEKYKQISGEMSQQYAISLYNLGRVYARDGNISKARPLLENSLELTRKVLGDEHPRLANIYAYVGRFYQQIGENAQADQSFQKAVMIAEKHLGEHHPEFAHVLRMQVNFKFLTKKYKEAESIYLRANSNLFKQIEDYFPFLTEAEKEEFYNNKVKYHFEEFNSYALAYYKDQPEILGHMYNNQLATKALLLNAHNRWKQRIKTSGDTKLFRDYSEWENKKAYLIKLTQETDKDNTEEIRKLERELDDLEKRLSIKSERYATIHEKKRYTWQDIQSQLKEGEAAIEVIRYREFGVEKMLADQNGKSYPEFGFTDKINYAVLIVRKETQGNPELVLIEDGYNMENKLLRSYRNQIRYRKEDTKSYQIYWEPIQKKLGGIKKVYFSPDGVYNQINLNTILAKNGKSHLIDELDIQLVTNTKDLLEDVETEYFNRFALFFGAPNYGLGSEERKQIAEEVRGTEILGDDEIERSLERGGYKLSHLPGTKVEVENISGILTKTGDGWEPQVFLGDQALEEHIKGSNKPRILHIATHGFFQQDIQNKEDNPYFENPLLRSGLLLTGASLALNKDEQEEEEIDEIDALLEEDLLGEEEETDKHLEDGILTAYEAMNLNLENTDLVVLSACETGLGVIKNGEGVYGLQRAFKVAGARTIVMSLWKVNDQTTQELMQEFYSLWLETDDKHLAFRKAQMNLRKKHPEPYYWGAFVIVGE